MSKKKKARGTNKVPIYRADKPFRRNSAYTPVFRADIPLDMSRNTATERAAYAKNKREIRRTGYCYAELMDLDRCIAAFILPRLIAYKAEKYHGIPNGLMPDPTGPNFDFTNTSAFDIASAKWDEMVDKMIWSFNEILHGENDLMHQDGMLDRPDYREIEKAHYARIREGMDLFAEYIQALWM